MINRFPYCAFLLTALVSCGQEDAADPLEKSLRKPKATVPFVDPEPIKTYPGSFRGRKVTLTYDKRLRDLGVALRENWKLRIENDTLVIESNEPLCVSFYNAAFTKPFWARDEADSKETPRDESIDKCEHSATTSFLMKNKWTDAEYNHVEAENQRIRKSIYSLKEKYALSNIRQSHRWTVTYLPETPEEESRIKKYEAEAKELEKGLVRLPDFDTQNFSLFHNRCDWRLENHPVNMIPIIGKEDRKKIDHLEATLEKVLRLRVYSRYGIRKIGYPAQ